MLKKIPGWIKAVKSQILTVFCAPNAF